MSLPLEGIKVIDLGGFIFGPHTAANLADMGANVIKIEHPAGGDPARGLQAIRFLPASDFNYMFEQDNRNKRSLTLDLNQPEGREAVYRLVKDADIFLSNFQAEVLKRLGVDYETLSRINPRLIYAFASGWGLKGPDKDKPAFDFVAFARSGLMATLGDPDSPPVPCLPALGDHIAAMTLAYGIMLALYHRERTGEGQMVHVSLLGSLIEAGSLNLQACLSTGQDMPRTSRREAANPMWNYYQTKDGRWIQLAMLQTDRHWHDFCQALELGAVEADPRFANHELRGDNSPALIAILEQAFAKKTLEEWVERFRGRNIIWGYVNTFAQVGEDLQLWENGYLINLDHPVAGPIKFVGLPVQLSKTPGRIEKPAPELGQHTEEVLLEAGYSWDEILQLKEKGVIL